MSFEDMHSFLLGKYLGVKLVIITLSMNLTLVVNDNFQVFHLSLALILSVFYILAALSGM